MLARPSLRGGPLGSAGQRRAGSGLSGEREEHRSDCLKVDHALVCRSSEKKFKREQSTLYDKNLDKKNLEKVGRRLLQRRYSEHLSHVTGAEQGPPKKLQERLRRLMESTLFESFISVVILVTRAPATLSTALFEVGTRS